MHPIKEPAQPTMPREISGGFRINHIFVANIANYELEKQLNQLEKTEANFHSTKVIF